MNHRRQPFDATSYWQSRHSQRVGLEATGTLGAPLAWQRWMYRGKVRAFDHALAAAGFDLRGARALNFGCGTGFFEDHWEQQGAAQTAGIDVVESVIEELRRNYPYRRYLCGNLGVDPGLAEGLGLFNLVTAIDVLYHVVAEDQLDNILSALVNRIDVDGLFLFTDALVDKEPDRHVRFRSLESWHGRLARHAMQIVAHEPVFLFQNRPTRLTRIAPAAFGSIAYFADSLLLHRAPRFANNFLILCRRA